MWLFIKSALQLFRRGDYSIAGWWNHFSGADTWYSRFCSFSLEPGYLFTSHGLCFSPYFWKRWKFLIVTTSVSGSSLIDTERCEKSLSRTNCFQQKIVQFLFGIFGNENYDFPASRELVGPCLPGSGSNTGETSWNRAEIPFITQVPRAGLSKLDSVPSAPLAPRT